LSEAGKAILKEGILFAERIVVSYLGYAFGATIVEERLKRAAASTVKVGDRATIRISPSDSQERKRFSIAHELGHFVMNHIKSILKACGEEDMRNWSSNTQETQAYFFASELILPKRLMKKRCDVKRVNFEPVIQIAKDFRASLTATSIGFVRNCSEQCAVVFSSKGKIQWFYKSDDWWPFIRRGNDLDVRTVASDYFKKGELLADEPVGIDGDAWVESDGVDLIIEHSISSPRHGFVLSLLWIKP